jgi:hypothetical protein
VHLNLRRNRQHTSASVFFLFHAEAEGSNDGNNTPFRVVVVVVVDEISPQRAALRGLCLFFLFWFL